MPAASPFVVRKAAVLGAGVMGAQIAAHLVNANVPAVLYELPAKEGDPNGNVLKAIDNLRRLEPSPLASRGESGLHRGGELRPAPRPAEGVRSRHRGDLRADGLEGRSLPESRAAPRRARDLREQHLRALDQQARGILPGGSAQSILRRALLQSAALHASRRADPGGGHRRRDTRRPREDSWSRRSARA